MNELLFNQNFIIIDTSSEVKTWLQQPHEKVGITIGPALHGSMLNLNEYSWLAGRNDIVAGIDPAAVKMKGINRLGSEDKSLYYQSIGFEFSSDIVLINSASEADPSGIPYVLQNQIDDVLIVAPQSQQLISIIRGGFNMLKHNCEMTIVMDSYNIKEFPEMIQRLKTVFGFFGWSGDIMSYDPISKYDKTVNVNSDIIAIPLSDYAQSGYPMSPYIERYDSFVGIIKLVR